MTVMGVVKVKKYKQLILPNTTVIKLITVPTLSSLMNICQFPTFQDHHILDIDVGVLVKEKRMVIVPDNIKNPGNKSNFR